MSDGWMEGATVDSTASISQAASIPVSHIIGMLVCYLPPGVGIYIIYKYVWQVCFFSHRP